MAIIPNQAGQGVVIETPADKKNKKMLTLLVVILAITGAIVYFGFGRQAQPPAISEEASAPAFDPQEQKFDLLKSASLSNPIFNNKAFNELFKSQQLPVVVGEKGRSNPFLPF